LLSEYKSSASCCFVPNSVNDACRQCYCVCNITPLRNTPLTKEADLCSKGILHEHVLADRDGFIPEHLAKSKTLMPLVSHHHQAASAAAPASQCRALSECHQPGYALSHYTRFDSHRLEHIGHRPLCAGLTTRYKPCRLMDQNAICHSKVCCTGTLQDPIMRDCLHKYHRRLQPSPIAASRKL
jgi:hypothetical protein